MRPVSRAPRQLVDTAVGRLAAGIVDLPVVLERAVDLVQRVDTQYQLSGGVPGVHQEGMTGQRLVLHDLRQHVLDLIALALTVAAMILVVRHTTFFSFCRRLASDGRVANARRARPDCACRRTLAVNPLGIN